MLSEVGAFQVQNFVKLDYLNFTIPGAQPEIFQGRGGFVELEYFDKLFVKNTKIRPRREKFLSFVSQILLKLHFEQKIQPKDGHNQDLLFQNQCTFSIFKKGQVRSSPFPPPSCVPEFPLLHYNFLTISLVIGKPGFV